MLVRELLPRPTGLAQSLAGRLRLSGYAYRSKAAAPRVRGCQGSYQLVHRHQWVNVDTTKEELIL